MNAEKCRQCGEGLVLSPHCTTKQFCGKDCRDKWWNQKRSQGLTQSEWHKRRHGEVPTKQLTDLEAVWLAAMIDGEGTIGIYRSRREKNRSGWRYHASCSIANTNKALIDRIVELTGCWVSLKKYAKAKPYKDIYRAEIKQRKLEAFLPQIIPHLVAKQQQANLVMQFLETIGSATFRTASFQPEFDRFYQETRQLNQRGRQVA